MWLSAFNPVQHVHCQACEQSPECCADAERGDQNHDAAEDAAPAKGRNDERFGDGVDRTGRDHEDRDAAEIVIAPLGRGRDILMMQESCINSRIDEQRRDRAMDAEHVLGREQIAIGFLNGSIPPG